MARIIQKEIWETRSVCSYCREEVEIISLKDEDNMTYKACKYCKEPLENAW